MLSILKTISNINHFLSKTFIIMNDFERLGTYLKLIIMCFTSHTRIIRRELIVMSKQGRQNKNQTGQQLAQQQGKNDIELGSDFQIGNDNSQSQKKSGKQANKK
jgi:hypothetical protein